MGLVAEHHLSDELGSRDLGIPAPVFSRKAVIDGGRPGLRDFLSVVRLIGSLEARELFFDFLGEVLGGHGGSIQIVDSGAQLLDWGFDELNLADEGTFLQFQQWRRL